MKKFALTYFGIAAVTVALSLPSASFFTPAAASETSFQTGYLSNVAVQGYDPVAYFTDAKPVKGSSDLSTKYKGAEFHFSSQANLDAFKKDPAAYAPQYGGYCAWAVAQGYTAKGSAKHWRVVDGKLYLNYSAGVKKTWESDIPGFISKADANWPSVLN